MAKGYPGLRTDARALSSYVKLLRAGESLLGEAARPLALYDLTPCQFDVLEALCDGGPQRLGELDRRILKSGGNLTHAVASLQRRRLIRRAGRRPKRLAALALTPKGRNLVRTISPGYAAAVVGVMSRLTGRELETLGALCGKLGHSAPVTEC